MKIRLAGLAVAAALTASLSLGAGTASATCKAAVVEGVAAAVACADAALNPNGTTVAPTASASACGYVIDPSWFSCDDGEPIVVGTTGATLGAVPIPQVDPTGPTVKSDGGTVATVWVNGSPTPVNVPGYCVGDPEVCFSIGR